LHFYQSAPAPPGIQLDTPLFLFLPGDQESRISAAKKLSAADNFL